MASPPRGSSTQRTAPRAVQRDGELFLLARCLFFMTVRPRSPLCLESKLPPQATMSGKPPRGSSTQRTAPRAVQHDSEFSHAHSLFLSNDRKATLLTLSRIKPPPQAKKSGMPPGQLNATNGKPHGQSNITAKKSGKPPGQLDSMKGSPLGSQS